MIRLASVYDHAVQFAMFLQDLVNGSLDAFFFGDVGLYRQ